MATIPNLVPQPGEQFQPQLHAEVMVNCVHFKMQKEPLTIQTLIVPDALMTQVIAIWLREHPDEAVQIVRAVRQHNQQNEAIRRTVESTRND